MKKRQNAVHPPRQRFDFKDAIFLSFVILCFIILAFFLFGCNPVESLNDTLKVEDDSLVEEIAEAVIENQIGLEKGSLDLTPRSPE